MPNFKKEISKCKHPNSRKTIALTKKSKKISNKEAAKTGQLIKQNITGEKIMWFKDNLPPDHEVCNKEQILTLVEKYLGRFDEELEQIALRHSIGDRKGRQHASREDVILMSKKNEKEEHENCGLEIPDLTNRDQVLLLKTWNGELRYLNNFKLRRFPKRLLIG